MPFRARFDCLWCGSAWETRGPDDLEGWSQLCPACLGRAQENRFLAHRLRNGIAERGRAGAAARAEPDPEADLAAWLAASVAEEEDRYLRRGRHSRGPVRDLAWQMELDAATGWLDRQATPSPIVEPAAGPGFWSPLLAGRGELSIHDASEAALDAARSRLVAHGLRAHLHRRTPWTPPDAPAGTILLAFRLRHVPAARLGERLAFLRDALRPGGRLLLIEPLGDPETDAVGDPLPVDGVAVRRLPDGREVRIPFLVRGADALAAALTEAGFTGIVTETTGRFFLLAAAERPPGPAAETAATLGR